MGNQAGATKKAFLYIRVSSFKQIRPDSAEGLSIPDQRLLGQQRAQQLGAEVVNEYVERESAKTAEKRPALQRMLADLRLRRDIDYVIVWKLDRFARNRFDDAIVGRELEELGVSLVSASENIDETPGGKLLRGLLSSFNEYENNIRAERPHGADAQRLSWAARRIAPRPGTASRSRSSTAAGGSRASMPIRPTVR